MRKTLIFACLILGIFSSCGSKEKISSLERQNKEIQDLLNITTVKLKTSIEELEATRKQQEFLKIKPVAVLSDYSSEALLNIKLNSNQFLLGANTHVRSISTDSLVNTNLNSMAISCEQPKTLEDLTGGYDVFFTSQKAVTNANGKITLLDAKSEKEINRLVYKFIQYKNQYCIINGEDKQTIWGIGIELTLNVKNKNKKLGLTSLPNIAAAVNYKEAEVEYHLRVIGITGKEIINNTNLNGDFNVDNYGKIVSKIDEIIKGISSEGTVVTPQLIAIL